LVIKLDDLLTHLQSVSDLVSRLSRLQIAQHDVAHTVTHVLQEDKPKDSDLLKTPPAPPSSTADAGLAATLQQLAARVARENNKEAAVKCVGFEAIPEDYRRAVKDIGVQAVRNAIVHGIELPAVRLSAGKPQQGLVRLTFQTLDDGGYKLVVEDDGQGLSTERIKEAALKKGFITPEKAQILDTKQVFSLMFHAGFSTLDTATKDAGRGVGMNLIADLTNQMGGKVSVATSTGKFTRLTMTMPHAAKRVDDTEAA
jgi:signal transduction histidine kinase